MVANDENNNKRRRLLSDDSNGETPVRFLDLPLKMIIQFLLPADRLALSTTCKVALTEVESYCEVVIKVIADKHDCKVDDSFQERIRDQARKRIQSSMGIGRNTERPLELPFRLLLPTAFQTCLTMTTMAEKSKVSEMVLLPSENRLALKTKDYHHRGFINVFELSTKDCVATLDLSIAMLNLVEPTFAVLGICFLNDNKILLRSLEWICLWTLADETSTRSEQNQNVHLLFKTPPATLRTHTWVRNMLRMNQDQFIFVTEASTSTGCSIYTSSVHQEFEFQRFDVKERYLTTLFTMQLERINRLQLAGVIGQKWLVFVAFGKISGSPLWSSCLQSRKEGASRFLWRSHRPLHTAIRRQHILYAGWN
jgi:hypothetical protein